MNLDLLVGKPTAEPRNADAKKPVLAIDMDEVLSMTHEALIKFHNEMYNTNLQLHDFTS